MATFPGQQNERMGPEASVEWAQVDAARAVVATSQTAWLYPLLPPCAADPWAQPMTGPGRTGTTSRLLSGCFLAPGQPGRAASEAVSDACPPALAWAWRMIGMYHTTHVTPGVLRHAAERLELAGRHPLAAYLRRKAREETGHDTLALHDLQALGYHAQAAVDRLCPATPAAMVAYFAACAKGDEPVRVLGYAYALELSASHVGEAAVHAVEQSLPDGVQATRCLRVHSAIGSDSRHVGEAATFIATLPADERTLIAQACFETAAIINTRRGDDRPTAGQLAEWLTPFAAGGECDPC